MSSRPVAAAVRGDFCLDHKSENLVEQLSKACDDGIDVYFENVGGKVFDAIFPLLNTKARIPVCGLISQYNATELPDRPDRLSMLMDTLLVKRIKAQGFIVLTIMLIVIMNSVKR
ncbi:MAG: NADPH-dependent curcumin reductase CurA [Sphingobacteriales bacterium]